MNRDHSKIPIKRFLIMGIDSGGESGYLHEPSGYYFKDSGIATAYESKEAAETSLAKCRADYSHEIIAIKKTAHELLLTKEQFDKGLKLNSPYPPLTYASGVNRC